MWLLMSLALAGSEVTISATAPCEVEVDGASDTLKARKSETFKVKSQTVAVRVGSTWIGELELPDRTEASLVCDGTSLQLTGAVSMGPKGAGLAKTAMAVGAGAAAAKDAAGAASEAGKDFKSVSNGEMPANGSSRTEISMEVGPDGFSSSTSRTTAGPNGVNHESSSTSYGKDGLSRSTASGQVGPGGASFESSEMSGSIRLPGKGGTVRLTQTNAPSAAAPASTPAAVSTPAPAAAPAPTPPPTEDVALPKEVKFTSAGSVSADGVQVEVRDPLATEGEAKVNLKVSSATDFVVFETSKVTWARDGSGAGPKTDKRVILPPGKGKGTTLVWPSDLRGKQGVLTVSGIRRVSKGAPIASAPVGVASGTSISLGDATCTVDKAKVSSKESKLSMRCEAKSATLVDASAVRLGDAANTHKKAAMVLLWPGETEKFDLVFAGSTKGVELDFGGAAHQGDVAPVAFEPVALSGSW